MICAMTSEEESHDVVIDLVHDLRQPLSSIEAIAFYLELRLSSSHPELRHYVRKLRDLVEEANARISASMIEKNTIAAAQASRFNSLT